MNRSFTHPLDEQVICTPSGSTGHLHTFWINRSFTHPLNQQVICTPSRWTGHLHSLWINKSFAHSLNQQVICTNNFGLLTLKISHLYNAKVMKLREDNRIPTKKIKKPEIFTLTLISIDLIPTNWSFLIMSTCWLLTSSSALCRNQSSYPYFKTYVVQNIFINFMKYIYTHL